MAGKVEVMLRAGGRRDEIEDEDEENGSSDSWQMMAASAIRVVELILMGMGDGSEWEGTQRATTRSSETQTGMITGMMADDNAGRQDYSAGMNAAHPRRWLEPVIRRLFSEALVPALLQLPVDPSDHAMMMTSVHAGMTSEGRNSLSSLNENAFLREVCDLVSVQSSSVLDRNT